MTERELIDTLDLSYAEHWSWTAPSASAIVTACVAHAFGHRDLYPALPVDSAYNITGGAVCIGDLILDIQERLELYMNEFTWEMVATAGGYLPYENQVGGRY